MLSSSSTLILSASFVEDKNAKVCLLSPDASSQASVSAVGFFTLSPGGAEASATTSSSAALSKPASTSVFGSAKRSVHVKDNSSEPSQEFMPSCGLRSFIVHAIRLVCCGQQLVVYEKFLALVMYTLILQPRTTSFS